MADSRASASAGSNNPFRRKATSAPAASSLPPTVTADSVFEPPPDTADLSPRHPTTSDFFRQQLQALAQAHEPPPSTTFQKPKVVKKVRVQSPPPSSPESATGAPHDYPVYGYGDESESSSSDDDDAPEDPFRATAPPLRAIAQDNYSIPTSAPPVLGRPPPNPFKKTLEDMEHGSGDVPPLPSPSVGGKGSLDVDAFKRLLMTGHTDVPGTTAPSHAVSSPSTLNPPSQAADAASITDASSISRQSIFDPSLVQETPRTSHEISEAEGEEDRLILRNNPQAKTQQTTPIPRKKPPPPSSRHGKLIKVDLSQPSSPGIPDGVLRPSSSSSQKAFAGSPGASSLTPRQWLSNPTDMNKPLPPAPVRRSLDESSESIFDREAAGKVPEPVDTELAVPDDIPTPRPPTPPNTSHATTAAPPPPDPRKPAPPPRRNLHSRSESKVSLASKASPAPQSLPTFTEEPSFINRRSSQDSTRSRSSSLRASIHAPAPPPPRRPTHASRPSLTSPSGTGLAGVPLTSTSPSAVASPSASEGDHPPTTTTPHNPAPLPPPPVDSPESLPLSPAPAASSSSAAPIPAAKPAKPSPPPLPPARNASVRTSAGRPASVRGVDAPSSRRVRDRDKDAAVSAPVPPPPPPPAKRSRAGSSGRAAGALGGSLVEGRGPAGSGVEAGDGGGAGEKSADDILADLEELQREVDALRGRYERKAGEPAGV